MMWFKDRSKLARHFEKWAKEIKAEICPLNVITWLTIKNLLNEKEAKKYLEEQENENNHCKD